MTNQQYIEEIIKVAIEGDWIPSNAEVFKKCKNKKEIFETFHFCYPDGESIKQHRRYFQYFLDPNFFRAIGKVKGWGTIHRQCGTEMSERSTTNKRLVCWLCYENPENDGIKIKGYLYYWHLFIDKIDEKDLDHAIEWLYNLIKE